MAASNPRSVALALDLGLDLGAALGAALTAGSAVALSGGGAARMAEGYGAFCCLTPAGTVFKTSVRRSASQAGSILVRLR